MNPYVLKTKRKEEPERKIEIEMRERETEIKRETDIRVSSHQNKWGLASYIGNLKNKLKQMLSL